ncbi:polyketide cyclase / dehydrase and lipid transport [Actinomycetes bacterium M1A6_2h]
MSSVQVADQTFVAAPGEVVARILGERHRWRRWFPGLDVSVREDRGGKGVRWVIGGELVGTMEVWLEPSLDGVIVHYFLHAEPVGDANPVEITRARRIAGKTMSFDVKAEAERGRAPGEPPLYAVT